MSRKMAQTAAASGGKNPADGEGVSRRGVGVGMHVADDNPWQLESYDQPGMVLVSTVLTGNNYLVWSKFVTLALGAKGKLGFVNGEIEALDENSPNYSKWKRVDSMVFCWIINSLSKEIMEAFIYAENAKDLWNDLAQVYGQRSGPLIFLRKREMMIARQGSESVTQYFTKLMKLGGEFGYVVPKPVCDCECDARKDVTELEMSEKVGQFLIGLDESFHQVREQIFKIDPLPDIYEAYSKVLVVEKFVFKLDENAAENNGGGKRRPQNASAHFAK